MKIVTITMASALLILSAGVLAEVRLASPFADGMVLQRDREVSVWGTADAGEKVRVMFAGNEVTATADEAGAWSVRLPKMAASKEGRILTAMSEETKIPQTISDVLVGEVWYCCGQSNTELPLVGDNPHFSDRQGRLVAQMTRKPFVRFAYAADYKFSGEPRKTAPYPIVWQAFTPENLTKGKSFSAMGVYFALELYSALDIPIGIVGSYWGGTMIDPWTPRTGYENHPELQDVADWKFIPESEWNDSCKKGGFDRAHQQPSCLWNEMVAPWCPMTMRGFIWYQGCSNHRESERYCAKMHALYDGWAKEFENPNLKLYFVQLAPYEIPWWGLQLAQAKFAAEEPNAAMVTTVDIGNLADIHPNEKGTIGKRLAALALRHDYGFEDLVADAPTLRGICSEEGRLILSFNNAKRWYVYQPDWGVDYGFEIAGPDGEWKKAYLVNVNDGAKEKKKWQTNGRCEGRDLILAADGVEKPMKVRYLYNRPWFGTVYADSGLPLGPFEAEVKSDGR